MNDIRTFKEGEVVIVHNGTESRDSLELAQVAKNCSYAEHSVLIRYGNFNTMITKEAVHKAPATLKKVLSELRKLK